MKGQSCLVNPKHDNRLNWTKQVLLSINHNSMANLRSKSYKVNLLENEST